MPSLVKEMIYRVLFNIAGLASALFFVSIQLRFKPLPLPEDLKCETLSVSSFRLETSGDDAGNLKMETQRPPLSISYSLAPWKGELFTRLSQGEKLRICYPEEIREEAFSQAGVRLSNWDIYQIGTEAKILMRYADFQKAFESEKRESLIISLIGILLTWPYFIRKLYLLLKTKKPGSKEPKLVPVKAGSRERSRKRALRRARRLRQLE